MSALRQLKLMRCRKVVDGRMCTVTLVAPVKKVRVL